MGFESRGKGRTYYYAKVRVGGRVVSCYGGTGQAASEAAKAHAARVAARRAQWEALKESCRQAREELEARESEIVRYHQSIDSMFAIAMIDAGFYMNERVWRQRKRPMFDPDLLDDERKCEEARRFFDADPSGDLIDQHGGDLSKRLCEVLICSHITNHRQREAVRRKLLRMRADLLKPGRSAVEAILVERVLVGWLDCHLCDLQATRNLEIGDQLRADADLYDRLRNRSQRRLLQATRALETIRSRALPALVAQAEQAKAKRRDERRDEKQRKPKNRITRHLKPQEN